MKKAFASTKSILLKNDFLTRLTAKNKYIKTEHQDYGIRLATRLCDRDHKGLYIRLAKELPRNIIEAAAQFAIDYPVKSQDGNKGRVFMWKLKGICIEKGVKIPAVKRKLSKKQQIKKIQNKMF
jgi:hypothetical protein